MSDNKFILQLKGTQTPKSVVEIKNDKLVTPFTGVPHSTDVVGSIIDDKDSSVVVAKGAQNWKLAGSSLVVASSLSGDGADYTSEFNVSGSGLWINATYSLPVTIFSAGTKWALKLCGKNLLTTSGQTIGFTLVVKIGNTHITSKTFTVAEGANVFCRQLVIDFSESEQAIIKAQSGDSLTVQLLCSDTNASATIYNGMTVFTALQRRVDGDAVASDKKTFDEVVDDVEQLQEDLDDLEEYVDDTFVRLDGTSIMTAPLKFMSGSMRGAVGPYLNGVSFWKMDAQGAITNYANFTDSRFWPVTTNAIDLGRSANTWKDLYLGGKVYVATLNNGADLTVPNKSGTLATMGDVDLAANSGDQLTEKGVWYAKMYSATVAPSAEDGTNYADFSQTDGQGNPIIVIYKRQNGAWVQDQTITPPAEYNGYVPVTSKIWDIVEQAGQQGGKVLWSHNQKTFTPSPLIISFEDIEITGNSTVVMPQDPTGNQIVNKDYVDNHIPTGNFYHPDLFDWKWADHQIDDMSWLRGDTFSWQDGSVYQAAYKHLRNDMYNWYSWANNGTTIYTKKAYPEVGEKAYSNSALTTEVGEITAVTDTLDITVEKITVNNVVYDSVSGSNIAPTTETVGGVTVQYIPAEDGHKIVTDFHESEVADVYTATGVAWYYIIDYGFKRFKLPRTKFGMTGYRDGVGNYVTPGIPNITGTTAGGYYAQSYANTENTGVFSKTISASSAQYAGSTYKFRINTFDASLSNSVYGNSTTVQPPATQMYLYFYVGEFTQTAVENTAGLNAELFNGKVDVGHEVIAFQAPTAGNNYTWYRKYADGWIEQGGYVTGGGAAVSVSLPVTMSDANYHIELTGFLHSGTAGSTTSVSDDSGAITTTGFKVNNYVENGSTRGNGTGFWWEVKGMASS